MRIVGRSASSCSQEIVEVFNLFNGGVFGSGGARALQLAAQLSF